MKKQTRGDFARMIGLKKAKKQKRKRKTKQTGSGKLSPALMTGLVLGRMLSNKNKNVKMKKAIVDTMNGGQMNAITGVVKKFVDKRHSTSGLPKKYLTRLADDTKFVNALLRAKTPLNIKKKILTQEGGFIAALLPTILKTVGTTLLGGIAEKLF